MKKSVILLIIVVYLVSIVVVGLLGIQYKVFNQVIYVNKISYIPSGVLNEDKTTEDKQYYKKSGQDGYTQEQVALNEQGKIDGADVYIAEKFSKDLTLELRFKVSPDNATIKNDFNKNLFKFSFDQSSLYKIDEETGEQISGFVLFEENADGNAVVTFKDEGTFILTVSPEDGANVSLKVKIVVMDL